MFGNKKILGLDLGNSCLKAATLSKNKKSAKLTGYIDVPLGPSVIENGEIINSNAVTGICNDKVKKLGAKKLVFGLAGSAVMVKRITIPKMDEGLIAEQIRWEAEQYIPYDVDEVNLDYVVLQTGRGTDTLELLLVAAQRSVVDVLSDIYLQGGLTPESADINSFALANCFLFNYPEASGSAVGLIDIGAFFSQFVILVNSEVLFCRDIPTGGTVYDVEISRAMEISQPEAEELKLGGGPMPDVAVDVLTQTNQRIAEQLKGAYEFFLNTSGLTGVEQFFITGGASRTPGLTDEIVKSLSAKVGQFDPLRNINPTSVEKKVSIDELRYKGAVSLGLALRKSGDS